MTAILLAMMLIETLGPDTTGQTLLSKKMEGVPEVFATSPTLMNVTGFSRTSGHRGCFRQGIGEPEHHRRIARGHRQFRRVSAEQSWSRARNQTDHDRDGKAWLGSADPWLSNTPLLYDVMNIAYNDVI
jgi:hypothetical protein